MQSFQEVDEWNFNSHAPKGVATAPVGKNAELASQRTVALEAGESEKRDNLRKTADVIINHQ
jgi:hypothetical protein